MRRALFLLTFGAAGLAVLLALGTWQVRRLAWKEALLADIETRIAAPSAALPAQPDPVTHRYLPVSAEGRFGIPELHVFVPLREPGPGYRIIAPFDTGGRQILVDRGFVPSEAKTDARTAGPMTVTGNLHWPDEIDWFTPVPDAASETWFARDLPAMAAALDTEPVLLVAQSATDPDVTPIPVDTAGIPNNHLQYAVTWFGLAAVWAAMTCYYLWRTRARIRG